MLFHITVATAGMGIPPKADLRLFQNRYKSIICDKENVSAKALKSELVEEWGLSLTETSRHLGVSPSAIAKTLYRLDKHKSS
jgi:hypothetical protein